MNKGLKLRLCKECKRKRFCKRERIPGHNFKYTCSKGHSWILKGITTERIESIMREVILSNVNDLFNRDDAFYRMMKR